VYVLICVCLDTREKLFLIVMPTRGIKRAEENEFGVLSIINIVCCIFGEMLVLVIFIFVQ